jgi:arylsulfatase A-like enzyme
MPRAIRAGPALLALLAGACSPAQGEGRTGGGVLVIAVDGLRADHLSSFGYDRPTTPSLDALAADGVTFTQAFTSAPALLPAHVALMTGCEPGVARRFLPNEYEGLKERRWRIPARVPHLAIELLAAGFRTAAFVDDPWLDPVHGFGPGFQVYDVLSPESAEDWEGAQPARLIDRFLQWLRALDGDESWFAYLHLHELERSWSRPDLQWDGYFQPRPELSQVPPVGNTDSVFFTIPRSRWRGGSRPLGLYEASYDGHLRALDAELERLFASLRRAGRFEDTTIHVVGSHGLQFGEAGLYLRSGRYSQADLHVPWIVRPRRGLELERGRRTEALASLLDLAPTVLELEGLAVPPGMHGRSQAALVRAAGVAPVRELCFASCGMQEGCALIGRRYCLEYLLPAGTEDAQLRRSWFGDWVESSVEPSLHFYDRLETPHPPLYAAHAGPREEFERLRQTAAEWMRDVNSVRLHLQFPAGSSPLDEAVLERLRARGFLGKGP